MEAQRPVGFYTEEIREGGVRQGFRWVGFDGRRGVLAHVGFSSRFRVGKYRVDVDGFDRFLEGIPFLAPATKLVIVDEIGKMECFSSEFRALVEDMMNSDKSFVATVALKGKGLIGDVKQRPGVELIEVTSKNRSGLAEDLAARLG
jgi:nucleoside-triphosphatase